MNETVPPTATGSCRANRPITAAVPAHAATSAAPSSALTVASSSVAIAIVSRAAASPGARRSIRAEPKAPAPSAQSAIRALP
jgi:hypothetical protein